jgi:pantoate--beta-alanine ligase
VLTVVIKLFGLVRPDVAVFGQKDAQQLTLVRQMVADFALGIEIEAVPTVRAADGLALSSRNKYLDPAQRAVATVLYRSLVAGAAAAAGGPRSVRAAAWRVLSAAQAGTGGAGLTVDYLALVAGGTYETVRDDDFDFAGPAVLAVAARVGPTRLIDNVPVRFGTEHDAADD